MTVKSCVFICDHQWRCPFVSSRYLDRIIRGPELHEFAAMLMPHQKATTADGEPQVFLRQSSTSKSLNFSMLNVDLFSLFKVQVSLIGQ